MVISLLLVGRQTYGQSHTCPININFAAGDLSNWSALTGLMGGATVPYPKPNNGLQRVPEYNLSTTGISIITASTSDYYGKFPTIPAINGYQYTSSVKLGSTATSHDLVGGGGGGNRNPGGFRRNIAYTIDVPAGSVTEPYTVSYAYALVLENGTHNSNEQPLFKAILQTKDSVIACASPRYYLPTLNDARGGGRGGSGGPSTGATLDSAKALADGFVNSPEVFLSYSGTDNSAGTYLRDVWTKNWTEVTVDLAAYRGQEVTLTFEVDNCVPGAHFAYAYVALRSTCAGPKISGFETACTNAKTKYTIPGLPQATYYWTVPDGWKIDSGANTNTITVTPGTNGGSIRVRQVNACADLSDAITVNTSPGTVAGEVGADARVCSGINTSLLKISGNRGSVLDWLSSNDDTTWTSLGVTGDQYNANNLTSTTHYVALVQNGEACSIDTSGAALVTVDPVTKGGFLSPVNANFCKGQTYSPTLTLLDNVGSVVNWQQSPDSISWNNLLPVYQQQTYSPGTVSATTFYRVVVESGVCPADTSAVADVKFYDVAFPQVVISPDSFSICYGKPVQLTGTISVGTRYIWSTPSGPLPGAFGPVSRLPQNTNVTFTPLASTDATLTVYNEGCPNPLLDTAYVAVTAPIIVAAGNDTSVVVGQPVQLHASSNSSDANNFSWTPATGLNNDLIADPIGLYSNSDPAYITYTVTAATSAGCTGTDNVTVRIFKTLSDIFIPNAFTPNHDGKNDVLRPVYAGIETLQIFSIYNRWGQLVFSTRDMSKGWDGNVGGNPQSTGSFVYFVQGIDYTGRPVSKKGTITLIR